MNLCHVPHILILCYFLEYTNTQRPEKRPDFEHFQQTEINAHLKRYNIGYILALVDNKCSRKVVQENFGVDDFVKFGICQAWYDMFIAGIFQAWHDMSLYFKQCISGTVRHVLFQAYFRHDLAYFRHYLADFSMIWLRLRFRFRFRLRLRFRFSLGLGLGLHFGSGSG